MGRLVDNSVSVSDLEFVVEHLIRLAYSTPRADQARASLGANIALGIYRRKLLQIADNIEILADEAGLQYLPDDFCVRVDQTCADLQGIILKTLNAAGKQRMKTSIRQKRHKHQSWPYDMINRAYVRAKAENSKSDSQKALNF